MEKGIDKKRYIKGESNEAELSYERLITLFGLVLVLNLLWVWILILVALVLVI